MKAIGLDIGTTTICSSLIDCGTKEMIATRTLPNDAGMSSENSWERLQDPLKIREICQTLVNTWCCEHDDIGAIGVTGQMHGILFLKADGTPASPLYTWQDQRGELPYEGNISYSKYLSEKTGYAMATGYGVTTWFYLSENQLLSKEGVTFCTIADYIAMSLSGSNRPILHPSMAASLGMYDLKENTFDLPAFEKVGLSREMLPKVCTKEQPVGYYEPDAGDVCGKSAEQNESRASKGRKIPVSAAFGDNQASFLGSIQEGSRVLVNVGTGGQLSAYCDRIEETSAMEFRPYLAGTYLAVGSALCSGYAYSLLKNFFEQTLKLFGQTVPDNMYARMNQAAADCICGGLTADAGVGLCVDTRFHGTRKNPSLKGSVTNMGSGNFTPENLTAGVLQGICKELFDFYEQLPAACKESAVLTGSGNGIRQNPVLQQIFREAFQKELLIPAYTEEASYGSALFAVYCLKNNSLF